MSKFVAAFLPKFVLRFAQGLRFPQLFLLFAILFVFDLLIPDFIPFIDEILLGIVTLVFANLKRPPQPPSSGKVAHE